MNFFKELEQDLNIPTFEVTNGFRIIFLDGAVVVEGLKTISILETEQIVFNLSKNKIAILGNNLILKKLEKDTAIVTGFIRAIERWS